MKKGTTWPCEGRWHTDPHTGVRVRQVTTHNSINHPTYFLQSAFLPGDRDIFFISYRTGTPQLFRAGYPDGDLIQMTDGPGIHPFSPALHPHRNEIIFTRRGALCAIHLDNLKERVILDTGCVLGEPSISADGHWIAAAFDLGGARGIVVASLHGGDWNTIPFRRTVIHPQFNPVDSDWIEFAADPAPRMHRVRRDGAHLECLYQHDNDEFVVHETFLGKSPDLAFVVWPKRLCRFDWETREVTTIADCNAWHIAPNRAGTEIVCDSNHPDAGLSLIDVATGCRRPVCLSQSSNQGSQWKTSRYALDDDFKAAQSAANEPGSLSWFETPSDTVYGPQWTHPHPSWSFEESKIAFASDRTGTTQVYVAELQSQHQSGRGESG